MGQNIGVTVLNPGGTQYVNNITAAGVIKGNTATLGAVPGKLRKLNVQVVGTAGSYSFYDCNFIGAYAGGTTYYPGQGVTSGGNVFVCIAITTGNATSNATYWTQLNPVVSIPYGAADVVAGSITTVDFPFHNGIYLGAIATGATISASFD